LKFNKIDIYINIIALIFIMMLIGMLFNIWQLVFYTIPLLSIVLMYLGETDEIKRLFSMITLLSFSVITMTVFIWAGSGMTRLDATFGGFSVGSGVFIYIIWPLMTVSGIVYAIIRKA